MIKRYVDYLYPELKVKKKNEKPCKHCGKPIFVGDNYISVIYNDGVTSRGAGAFHEECWLEFLKEKLNKPKKS